MQQQTVGLVAVSMSPSKTKRLAVNRTNEITVVDEHGNTVGMLVSEPATTYMSSSSREMPIHMRYPVPCSNEATITTEWLTKNFEENSLTSVPRSIMFDEYQKFCRDSNTKPFNQAVFGKIVRACFPNLTTRRLGVRGQSRYHYAGLSVKLLSRYARKFHAFGEGLNLLRNNSSYQRRNEITSGGTTQTPEYNYVASHETVPYQTADVMANIKAKRNVNPFSLVLPPYPTEDDVEIKDGWTKPTLAAFLDFYRCYNRRLLGYIISLDFEKTTSHLSNFGASIPNQCKSMLKTTDICGIIALCDDIMFQEATTALLPDCLATLTTEFNVTIRKFAKTLPSWVGAKRCYDSTTNANVISTRIEAAKVWGEYVRRVTTLCHVAKEARKTLVDPLVLTQLLDDLCNLGVSDIVAQSTFAGGDDVYTTGDQSAPCNEKEEAMSYISNFCQLLQCHASVEMYVCLLLEIIDRHAGLIPESKLESKGYEVITDRTRQFVMKWAMYASKMLTEITLKSSESVGTFHLVMLLFGDYINHVICFRGERAKGMKRLRSVIKKGSFYFTRLKNSGSRSTTNNVGESSISNHSRQPFPLNNNKYTQRSGDNSAYLREVSNSVPAYRRNREVNERKEPKIEPKQIHCINPSYFPETNMVQDTRLDRMMIQNDPRPAVVVEPAFQPENERASFYLLPGNNNAPGGAMLLRK
nr:transcription factor RFX4-like isoform X2 [Ciona intestinalis]|eukprot:XP_026690016.1 transcription factor RFX4-like isoform X2 [Ciona intestinalis]